MSDKSYQVGAIIGRFQLHSLHEAHHWLIKQVIDKHKKVVIFLGVSKVLGTKRNPLDFDTRKKMIQKDYPESVILAIPDFGNDLFWSQEIDRRLREVYPIGDVILYGSRDSFIPHYCGEFDTKELEQHTYVSGTEVRRKISEEIKNSEDFRAGIIYNAFNQYQRVFPSVDIAAFNEDKSKILLGKKPYEDGYRFIGGFLNESDKSNELAAKRIFLNETGVEIDDLKYIGSTTIDDWRYKGCDEKIMTTLFSGKFIMGRIVPSQDLSELKWFDIKGEFDCKILIPEHRILMTKIYYSNIVDGFHSLSN